MYPNTTNSLICIAFFIGISMMSHPNIIFGDCKPFNGHYQYDRLTNIFCDVVKEHGYGLYLIGIMTEDIGTHSIQKGAATYVATGCTI